MSGHRLRVAWRKAILILIACVLVFVSSVQQIVVARSLQTAEPSHANHMQVANKTGLDGHSHQNSSQPGDHGADQSGHVKKDAKNGAQESQNGACCELNCITFAVIATAMTEIASPNGPRYLAAVFDDMNGHEVFDLMRPPRV